MINRSESRLIAKELRNQANQSRKPAGSKPKRKPTRSVSAPPARPTH